MEPNPVVPNCAPGHYLKEIGDYAVMVRGAIAYREWGVKRNNYEEGTLQRGYNLFYVSDIATQAGYALNEVLCRGAVVAMHLRWDCDIDAYKRDPSTPLCAPNIAFQRFDKENLGDGAVGSGFSIRQAQYYHGSGVPTRDLTKRWGLRMVVVTSGQASGFAYTTCAWAVASLFVLLAAARFAADFFFTFILEFKCLGPLTGHVTCQDVVCERKVGRMPRMGGHAQADDDLMADMSSSDDEEEAGQGTALVSAQAASAGLV